MRRRSSLLGQIAASTAGVVVDGANYSSSTSSFPYSGALPHTPNGTAPKAYLNWLVFDKNRLLDLSKSGYMQITTASKETGTDVPHERLFSPSISITEPGYVYIYLSNEETGTPIEVYFDDLKVTQVKTPIVQVEDFYPFGLTFNSYQRDSSMPDQYLYNGKELQDELSLGWLDYGARMYMPELGRWGVVDPLSERSRKWSSYTYGYDNPLIFIDPDGMFSDFYNTNGDKIGTDGTQETKKYIVLDDAEAKRIQESTTPVSRGSVKSSIENPSDEVVTKAGKVAKAAQGGEEHGFVVSSTGATSETIKGKRGTISLAPGYEELEKKKERAVFDVHAHGPGKNGEVIESTDAPSGLPGSHFTDNDFGYKGLKETQGVGSEPSWVIGTRNSQIPTSSSDGKEIMAHKSVLQIIFYRGSGEIGSMNFAKFQNLVKKLNKIK